MKTSEKLAVAVLSEAPREVRSLVIQHLASTLEPSKARPERETTRGPSTRNGSVRQLIHHVLQRHGQLPRVELIRLVSLRRDGNPIHLERSIDEAIRTDRTGKIQRVGRGVYSYGKEN